MKKLTSITPKLLLRKEYLRKLTLPHLKFAIGGIEPNTHSNETGPNGNPTPTNCI